ncbi:hypothetical protein [Couchioplanes azureus]|uniref:hypothetical protein n=1 Tax=Couchioplanes caeruleus TaxID=56438 RepID=UPI0016707A4E|nr:hypothetical protein [Couchioplanes caeruleus]GGQ60471.1 hypothetical protein GCM10010166_32620 [Couchioplanes caeruleus subsp. azureus]
MDGRRNLVCTTRAYAVFTSDLATGSRVGRREVNAVVRTELRRHKGVCGCLASVAYAYGDHPEVAAPRMRWARELAETTFAGGSASPAPPPRANSPQTTTLSNHPRHKEPACA